MKFVADAVAAILAHHRIVVGLGVFLYDMTNIAEAIAGLDLFYAQIEAFLGDLDESLGVAGSFTNTEHLAGVAEVTVLDDGNVEIDDVAILEDFFAGRDAVAYHVIDRGADRLGKAAVIEAGGDGLLHVDHKIMADLVEFLGADTGLHVGRDHFEDVGGELAGNAHFFDFFGCFDANGHELGRGQLRGSIVPNFSPFYGDCLIVGH